MRRDSLSQSLLLTLGITLLAVLVHGYHLGVEDQAVYLPGIKQLLDPALYPFDADFFLVQLQATLFHQLIAGSVRLTHLPLDWALFLWHLASIFLLLLGCRAISRRCFREPAAQWAAVATVAALLTLPVAGTALFLADQYLHPRALATVPILFAIVDVMDRRWPRVALWLLLAGLMHPVMAAFGLSFAVFLAWRAAPRGLGAISATLLLLPFGLLQTSPAWREATLSRDYFFLLRWHWYEWLGIFAPLALLWWYRKLAARFHQPALQLLSERLALFGLFQFAVAAVLTIPERFIALVPLQPMRFLHLLYILFFLFSGGLIGQWLLRDRPLRWLLLFLPLCGVMFYAQRRTFPDSPHVEWPGVVARNRWVEAFDWARQNTPRNALFALDPNYLGRPGEDNHGFRALAERSSLADTKDEVVAAVAPQLAGAWQQQFHALAGWRDFRREDFSRLHRDFGVTWVVVEEPGAGLACPYHREGILVCRVE